MIKLTFSFQKDLKSLNGSDYEYINDLNTELSQRVDALNIDLMRTNKEGI